MWPLAFLSWPICPPNAPPGVVVPIILGLLVVAVGGTLIYFGARYLPRRTPGDPLSTGAPAVLATAGLLGLAASCGVGPYKGEPFGTYGWLLELVLSLAFFIIGSSWQARRGL